MSITLPKENNTKKFQDMKERLSKLSLTTKPFAVYNSLYFRYRNRELFLKYDKSKWYLYKVGRVGNYKNYLLTVKLSNRKMIKYIERNFK